MSKVGLNLKNHIIRLLISIGFLLVILCVCSKKVCAIEGNENGFKYCTINNGTEIEITGYTGSNQNITIPETISVNGTDLPVTSIGARAFKEKKSIKSVVMPNVKNIGEYAFYYDDQLTSVKMENVESIGEKAFAYCDILSLTLPNVKYIEDYAFIYNVGLTSVDMPIVISIGKGAFACDRSFSSISLPYATSIGDGTFKACEKLERVELPNVTSIKDDTFSDCVKLKSLTIPKVTSIGYVSFCNCTSLTSVTLPNVTSIGDMSFCGCTSLTSVTLPNVTSVGAMSFGDCTSLTSVKIPDNVSIGNNVFDNCPSDISYNYLASSIAMDNETLTMMVGENNKLNPVLLRDVTKYNLIWSSSNPDVVSVGEDGTLNALSAGKATVTVKLAEDEEKKAECVVTVKKNDPDPDPDPDPNPDPDPEPEPEPEPIPENATYVMNQRLFDNLSYAASLNGYQAVYFDEYDGKDCLTSDVFNFLKEHPNVSLVLDYTFFDANTKKDIHCHVVINKAILSKVIKDDEKYYGAAILSGFVQYYNELPEYVKSMNY